MGEASASAFPSSEAAQPRETLQKWAGQGLVKRHGAHVGVGVDLLTSTATPLVCREDRFLAVPGLLQHRAIHSGPQAERPFTRGSTADVKEPRAATLEEGLSAVNVGNSLPQRQPHSAPENQPWRWRRALRVQPPLEGCIQQRTHICLASETSQHKGLVSAVNIRQPLAIPVSSFSIRKFIL